jgi:hypothetical protein
MSSRLEQLPEELLVSIIYQLGVLSSTEVMTRETADALRRLRLVSPRFAHSDRLKALLFRNVLLIAEAEHLARLAHDYTAIASHVRRVTFSRSLYSARIPRVVFEKIVNGRGFRADRYDPLDQTAEGLRAVEAAWESYSLRATEAESILSSGLLSSAWTSALGALTRVDSICIASPRYRKPAESRDDDENFSGGQATYEPLALDHLQQLVLSQRPAGLTAEELLHPVLVCLEALPDLNISALDLEVGCYRRLAWQPIWERITSCMSSLQHLTLRPKAWQSERKSWTIAPHDSPVLMVNRAWKQTIFRSLQIGAAQIRHLRLDFQRQDNLWDTFTPFPAQDPVVFPRLESLDLDGVFLMGHALVTFLAGSPTLSRFVLRSSTMAEDDLEVEDPSADHIRPIFDAIRDHPNERGMEVVFDRALRPGVGYNKTGVSLQIHTCTRYEAPPPLVNDLEWNDRPEEALQWLKAYLSGNAGWDEVAACHFAVFSGAL